MSNNTPHPDWLVIGDWVAYRYSQFVAVLAVLLFGWWVVRKVVIG